MGTHFEYEMDSGRSLSQEDDDIPPVDDEFRAVNVIIHLLGQFDQDEGSLLRILNSPTHSESSNGSWDPIRELYAIEGMEALTEEERKCIEDEEAYRQAIAVAAEAKHQRQEEEDRRNLNRRGRRVHEEIL